LKWIFSGQFINNYREAQFLVTTMENISRRNLLKHSGITVLGLATFSPGSRESMERDRKLKIIVVGAHPDDPETGCGGTMSFLAEEGHEVVSAYLTRGEAGIRGKSHEEAARIRTTEALNACKIMNARYVFLDQIDGSCEITAGRYDEMLDFITAETPDMVFTHWPVDQHRDHRICSILVYDAWLRMNKSFELFYFEVNTGGQTQNFSPTHFVDISHVIEKKHAACSCHVSQDIPRVYSEFHEYIEKFRGLQASCKYAEAFVKHDQSSLLKPEHRW
jgi:LmbE family N-acetylglucosaminyl deacetylase